MHLDKLILASRNDEVVIKVQRTDRHPWVPTTHLALAQFFYKKNKQI
jgi:hypothetical protein